MTQVHSGQPAYDIYIVGLGILGYLQVTRETEDALSACRKVYYLHTEPYITRYLNRFDVDVEDLYPLYEPGKSRLPTYHKMAEVVLQAAQEEPPVAFAVYGHPMMFVLPTRIIGEKALELNLRVKVLPGISALDCLMIDLNFDPGRNGLVQYDTTYALLYQPKLNPTVPCLLWQPGAVESAIHIITPSRPERFERLKAYLLQFYPADHMVAFAQSARNPLVYAQIIWVSIGGIPNAHETIHGLVTLFIPPASKPTIRDHELMRLLDDPAHLNAITEVEVGWREGDH
jgi:tetrapyrrole methylase family protein/MazG family protein